MVKKLLDHLKSGESMWSLCKLIWESSAFRWIFSTVLAMITSIGGFFADTPWPWLVPLFLVTLCAALVLVLVIDKIRNRTIPAAQTNNTEAELSAAEILEALNLKVVPTATTEELQEDTISHRLFRIIDLLDIGGVDIVDKTFVDCVIHGPAIICGDRPNHHQGCSWNITNPEDLEFAFRKSVGRLTYGVVRASRVNFIRCRFVNVAFLLHPGEFDTQMRNIKKESTSSPQAPDTPTDPHPQDEEQYPETNRDSSDCQNATQIRPDRPEDASH